MMGVVDPRLSLAVDASRAWYDDVFALHGVPTACDDSLWRALGAPPPHHSVAKTLRPGVPVSTVVASVRGSGSVADSFADLDLPSSSLLFEATWVHHDGDSHRGLPAAWSIITSPEMLAVWSRAHDYVGVLTAAVLDRPAFTILGCFDGEDLVGGSVLHEGSPTIGVSNMWALPNRVLDWEELVAAAHAVQPDRPLTGYARGEDLHRLLGAGWQAVGTQHVWARGNRTMPWI